MNNKGFTLVELLAVLVILLAISLVAVGGISSSLERRDVKECEEQRELAISAAKIYFSLNDVSSVSIGTLNGLEGREDYFKNDYKIDKLKDGDFIKFNNGKYVYVATDGSCVVNDNIDEDIDEDIDDDMQDVVEVITITYDANGGSGAPESQTKYKDTTLTLSTTKPTRNGYTFLGWSTDPSATTATYSAGGSYTDNAGATLYAVWKVGVLYLYNRGNTYNSITGGYYAGQWQSTLAFNSDHIQMDIYSDAFIRTKNKIDLSKYSTLSVYFDGLWTNDAWTMDYFNVGLFASSDAITAATQSAGSGKSTLIKISGQGLSNQSRTITVNISSLSGSYYVGFGAYTHFAQSFGGFKVREIKVS